MTELSGHSEGTQTGLRYPIPKAQDGGLGGPIPGSLTGFNWTCSAIFLNTECKYNKAVFAVGGRVHKLNAI